LAISAALAPSLMSVVIDAARLEGGDRANLGGFEAMASSGRKYLRAKHNIRQLKVQPQIG